MLGKQLQTAAAGSAGGEKVYVDDVFSPFLYVGNGGTQTITNGIDLDGEGGLVWIKPRDIGTSHTLVDSERGSSNVIYSNLDLAQETKAVVTGFNSDGFGVSSNVSGYHLLTNYLDSDYVSWTFRKAPGFLDIVTYTGNGSVRTISHSLGSVPGFIMVKRTDQAGPWLCFHRSLGNTKNIELQSTNGEDTNSQIWNNTDPTSTNFTVGTNANVNGSGRTFVAYVFAHDDQSFGRNGNESIIKCGSYTGNSSLQTVSLGWEPQWVLIKRTTGGTANWQLQDTMRGMSVGVLGKVLYPNSSSTESSTLAVEPTPTGFSLDTSSTNHNVSGSEYIYMAIRRPHKPPSAGTDVFAIDTVDATAPNFDSGFVVDAALRKPVANTYNPQLASRLTGGKYLRTSTTDSELDFGFLWDFNDGFDEASNSASSNIHAWMFRRAPGFFDVVAYAGNGVSGTQINHNLGATPEMFMVKNRTNAWGWNVYHQGVASDAETDYLQLNTNAAVADDDGRWADTAPTASVFTVGTGQNVNASGSDYIAYLFATLPGISKVGTYTGANSAVDVNCGFTNGARFVMIKRIGTAGHWYIWDTTRGIATGNDPYIMLSDPAPTTTTQDHIDPLSSGFKVNYTNFSAINGSGHEYLFLAIA